MNIIFYEAFDEEKKALKKFIDPRLRAKFISKTIQESGDKNPKADIISIRTQSIIPKEWTSQLKAVLARSQGFDHLQQYRQQTDFCGKLGYLKSYCSRAVAEHAVMSMMFLWRQGKKQVAQFSSFNRDGLTGQECYGKNACVIGVGKIGLEIVDILDGLRMNVCGVDIARKHKAVTYVSLNKAVQWADVIFCALPFNNQTKGLLGLKLLGSVKRGCVFVNISRAEISPIDGLKRLLDSGQLSALAMDVYEDEKMFASRLRSGRKRLTQKDKLILNLSRRTNVLFTPHNAFNSYRALEEKARQSAQAVAFYIKRGCFPNPVPE